MSDPSHLLMTEVTITIRDGTAFLGVDDPEVWESVIENTSFKFKGSEFRGRRGDRRVELVRNKKAPVGLLDRICRAMIVQDIVPEITYADTKLAPKPHVAMRLYGAEPRDYQVEAELAASLSDRGIFRAPTGSGKTLIAAQVIIAKGMHAVVIVPTIDLLRQTRQYFADHLARDDARSTLWLQKVLANQSMPQWRIGQLGDGVVDPQPVTVATVRTIAKVLSVAYESYEYAEYDDRDDTKIDPKELREWVEGIGTVIVDEAHQLGARVIYETMAKIPASCKFGMSASPWRDDGADLMIEAATGPPIFYVPAKRLVEEGHLMAPEFRVIDTSPWWTSAAWGNTCANCKKQWLSWTRECDCGCTRFRSQFQEAYKKEIAENPVRNANIAQIVQLLNRPTLVLVKLVMHGRLLEELIPGALFLSGKDKGNTREDAFDRVRAGKQQTIICTQIADQGLDLPNLGALVLAGGGKSSTRHLQRIGRVVRPAPGKPQPLVLDFDDSHVSSWFERHLKNRHKIEIAEWQDTGAIWTHG